MTRPMKHRLNFTLQIITTLIKLSYPGELNSTPITRDGHTLGSSEFVSLFSKLNL